MKEPITIKVNGQTYSFWDSADIVSEALNICRAFTVGMTVKAPGMATFVDTFKPGQSCEVFIGNDLVCTGYIDQTPVNYTATSMQAQIIGHSKTIDLVECTVAPQGESIKALTGMNSARWSVPKPPVPDGYTLIPSPASVTALTWRGSIKLYSLIAQLIAPYGIRLLVNDSALSIDTVLDKHDIDIEKTVLQAISEQVKERDLWITDNEYGDLVISTLGSGLSIGSLELGGNVLSGSITRNASKLFTVSDVAATKASTKTVSGSDASQIPGRAVMTAKGKSISGLTRFRYKRVKNDHADKAKADKQSKSEMEYELGQFLKASYSVQGWRQLPDVPGSPLWKVNSVVPVKDNVLYGTDGPDAEMVISKVEFVLDLNGGMITNIDVVPKNGVQKPDSGAETQQSKPSETKAGFANKSKSNGLAMTVISTDGTEKIVT